MKKFVAILLVFTLVLTLAACHEESGVLDEIKTYEITSNIHALDIEINAADFKIEYGNQFFVESNLKNLSVSERGGILKVVDKIRSSVTYTDAMLTLHLPHGISLEEVKIETGAANVTADTLSADFLKLELGAGNVEFGCLNANQHAQIEGGAGQITVSSGTLQDLSLRLGVGRLDLTAALLGESKLNLGVGESKITLIGDRDDYEIDIQEGIGSITLSEDIVLNSGMGQHHVQINGGIGSADLSLVNP